MALACDYGAPLPCVTLPPPEKHSLVPKWVQRDNWSSEHFCLFKKIGSLDQPLYNWRISFLPSFFGRKSTQVPSIMCPVKVMFTSQRTLDYSLLDTLSTGTHEHIVYMAVRGSWRRYATWPIRSSTASLGNGRFSTDFCAYGCSQRRTRSVWCLSAFTFIRFWAASKCVFSIANWVAQNAINKRSWSWVGIQFWDGTKVWFVAIQGLKRGNTQWKCESKSCTKIQRVKENGAIAEEHPAAEDFYHPRSTDWWSVLIRNSAHGKYCCQRSTAVSKARNSLS